MTGNLIIRNIKKLFLASDQTLPCSGSDEQANVPSVENAYCIIENGKISRFGPDSEAPEIRYPILDATDRFILPAWVDSHTHIVSAKSRESEFVDKIKGLSYEEIANRGGGILNSARTLAETSEDDLFISAWQRLTEIIGMGTGAIEIKSGYGLSYESELKMLRVIRRLKEKSNIPVKATFLGAHAYPLQFRENHQAYIDILVSEMLPDIAKEGLADYIDVFCDRGFFSPEETSIILEAGAKYGLKPKIHANELDYSGGVQVGVRHGAISVDHLECVGPDELESLKGSGTVATLLPSTAFFLGIDYAPARDIIDHGIPVAIASDYNPGSSPSGNMPFVMSLSCIQMKMLPEEALRAATLHGAYALEMENELGSVTPGKWGNLILTKKVPSLAFLPYSFGSDWIEKVVIKGIVH
jgi:imidazolonepropionase